jgi:hypothetical protein
MSKLEISTLSWSILGSFFFPKGHLEGLEVRADIYIVERSAFAQAESRVFGRMGLKEDRRVAGLEWMISYYARRKSSESGQF